MRNVRQAQMYDKQQYYLTEPITKNHFELIIKKPTHMWKLRT